MKTIIIERGRADLTFRPIVLRAETEKELTSVMMDWALGQCQAFEKRVDSLRAALEAMTEVGNKMEAVEMFDTIRRIGAPADVVKTATVGIGALMEEYEIQEAEEKESAEYFLEGGGKTPAPTP